MEDPRVHGLIAGDFRKYTGAVRSNLAEGLRRELSQKLRLLTPEERLAAAFRLGEEDLELYRGPRGLAREAARRLIRRQRQSGRRRSGCAE